MSAGLALALTGAAVAVLPGRQPATDRLAALAGGAGLSTAPDQARIWVDRALGSRWLVVCVAGVLGAFAALTAGVGTGLCAAIAGGLLVRRLAVASGRRGLGRERAALVEAVEALAGDLRAGRTPAAALAAAARSASGPARRRPWGRRDQVEAVAVGIGRSAPGRSSRPTARVTPSPSYAVPAPDSTGTLRAPRVAAALTAAAAATHLGGDPSVVLRDAGSPAGDDARRASDARACSRDGLRVGTTTASPRGRPGSVAQDLPGDDVDIGLRRLAAAWTVSAVTGSELVGVIETVERDLVAAEAHRRLLAVELSGPRATSVLLALLPVVGIVLGSMLGADPVHVLTTTPLGQVVLVAGTLLDVAGLWWTDRIVSSAAAS